MVTPVTNTELVVKVVRNRIRCLVSPMNLVPVVGCTINAIHFDATDVAAIIRSIIAVTISWSPRQLQIVLPSTTIEQGRSEEQFMS